MAAPEPQQEQTRPEIPAEDRILTPEETENLLRGYSLDASQREADADDTSDDQRQMVQDFFSEAPAQARVPTQVPLPHEQMAQAAPPARPPQEYVQQAAQQMEQTAQVPEPPTVAQIPVQQQASPELAAMQAQNQMLMTQIQALQAQVQGMQTSQQRPAPAAAQQQQTYDFRVPPQFLAAIQSEDSNQAQFAINTLLNHVAETVTQQIRNEQQSLRDEMSGTMRSYIGDYGVQQEVQRDMYGTYPELSGYRDFVLAAARQLSATMPHNTPWSADLRDQIAERVAPMVPGLYQKIQQIRAQRIGIPHAAPFQPQQALPQQQQPGQLPPGVRPVGVAGGVHGQPPVLARDPQGNLVHVQSAPQPYLGSPQARPSGSAVSTEVQDIWRTLGYEPYQ